MIRRVLFLSLLLIGISVPAHTQALPPIDEHYTSHIIPDERFIGGFNFREEDIQEFLEEQGADCEDDELCLKDYRDPDTDRSAAEIIATYAQEFALDPRVILVTLQKENSLITATEPEEWQYRTAMGYGCPDGEDCESDYFGFSNQVRLGANLLRVGYDRACGDRLSHFRWWVHPIWQQNSVAIIDGRPTFIGNCATASLYNYTPHRVDGAWKATDGVYYYGNYNFINLYQSWFE